MNLKHLFTAIAFTFAGCSDSSDPQPSPDAAPVSDLAVAASATRIPILQGSTATVEVSVTRAAGIAGAVVVEPVGLPAGVTFDPVTIAADATTGTLVLRADAAAAHSLPTAVTLRGTLGDTVAASEITVTVHGAPGALDTSFGAGGKAMIAAGAGDDYANAMAVQRDGKIVIAGRGAEHLGDFALVRLDRDGQLDATFGTGGRVLTDFAGAADTIHAIALQPDGKIVVAGTTTRAGTGVDFAVARYTTSGELDASFGTGGKVVTPLGPDADTAYALLIQPDGKIVVGGDSGRSATQTGLDFAVVRYTASGALDGEFGANGIAVTPIASNGGRDSVYALALQTVDGEVRIVAAGGEGDFNVVRYTAGGQLDLSFGGGDGKVSNLFGSTIGAARALAITPTGYIAVAGHSHHDVALAQLTSEGTLDPLFGTGGKVITAVTTTNWDEAQAITIDTSGKLVVAGWAFEGGSSAGNFAVLRYLTDGQLDPSFGGTGIVVTPVAAGTKADQAMAIAIQEDDRVPTHRLITAGFASVTNSDFAVTRYWR